MGHKCGFLDVPWQALNPSSCTPLQVIVSQSCTGLWTLHVTPEMLRKVLQFRGKLDEVSRRWKDEQYWALQWTWYRPFAAPHLRNASVIKCDGNVMLLHAMQAYRSSRSTALNLGTRRNLSGQLYAPAALPPLNRKLEWAAKPVWMLLRKEKQASLIKNTSSCLNMFISVV